MSLRNEIRTLAASQHGVASIDQIVLLGATRSAIRSCCGSGEFELATPRVLRACGAPATDRQGAMLAVLDAGPGAVLSCQSTMAMWEAPGFQLAPFHVTHPRGGLRRNEIVGVMHTSRRLPPHHVTVLDGIPVTHPARTLFDLTTLVHPGRLDRAIDNLWSNRLVSGEQLFAVAEELGKRGRAGTALFRELIEKRGRAYVPPASNLERRFHSIIEADGQPPLDRETNLGGDHWVGRVDAYDRPFPLVFEINGDRFHQALLDRQADERRRLALEALGFTFVPFSEHQVWYQPEVVRDRVWRARQTVRREHGARPILRRGAA
jgi:hypothetical protein